MGYLILAAPFAITAVAIMWVVVCHATGTAAQLEDRAIQEHPDYADGYADAWRMGPFDTDRAGSEEYAIGYDAGERAVSVVLELAER